MTDSEFLEELVMRAAEGDRDARSELLERYWSIICNIVRGRRWRAAGAPEQTVDLQQEVAIRVLEKLPRHRWRGRGAFIAWVKALADARIVDIGRYHHAAKRDVSLQASSATPETDRIAARTARSPESVLDRGRRLEHVEALLERLPPDHATAVRMHHMGYSHAEVGEVLETTPEAARKMIARAMAKLQRLRATGGQ